MLIINEMMLIKLKKIKLTRGSVSKTINKIPKNEDSNIEERQYLE